MLKDLEIERILKLFLEERSISKLLKNIEHEKKETWKKKIK